MERTFFSKHYLSIIFVAAATTILYLARIGLDEQLCGCKLVGSRQARILNGTMVGKNALRWVGSLFIEYQDLSIDKGWSVAECSSLSRLQNH